MKKEKRERERESERKGRRRCNMYTDDDLCYSIKKEWKEL